MIKVEQKEPGSRSMALQSCLTLIDLACLESEKAIVDCIAALSKKEKTIPYKESIVTTVLQVTELTLTSLV